MRILHVFRTPVGGLFRHVRDLSVGLEGRGCGVGLICDSETGGDVAAAALEELQPRLHLGVYRFPIRRNPGPSDLRGIHKVLRLARELAPDVIHCHGAKGGLFGRLASAFLNVPAVYAPHGGSLHYDWRSPAGVSFLTMEKMLVHRTDAFHFVCQFEKEAFRAKVGGSESRSAVIYNGLCSSEFSDVRLMGDAADVVYLGDMRALKGVDVLIRALAVCNKKRPVTAVLCGDGPDLESFRAMAASLSLDGKVRFVGHRPTREALSLGSVVVVPSRAESMPYVVLEAIAGGRPVIACDVGGIREVLPPEFLVPPGDVEKLADQILSWIEASSSVKAAFDETRSAVRKRFSADRMVDEVVALYRAVAGG